MHQDQLICLYFLSFLYLLIQVAELRAAFGNTVVTASDLSSGDGKKISFVAYVTFSSKAVSSFLDFFLKCALDRLIEWRQYCLSIICSTMI